MTYDICILNLCILQSGVKKTLISGSLSLESWRTYEIKTYFWFKMELYCFNFIRRAVKNVQSYNHCSRKWEKGAICFTKGRQFL